MLNILSLQKNKEVEAQDKDIDIVCNDETGFRLAFEFPSSLDPNSKHCKPIHHVSVAELSAQDPFNFKGMLRRELAGLLKKKERFCTSPSFILKVSGVALSSGEDVVAEDILTEFISKNPDTNLLHRLGDTYILLGKDKEALEIFEKMNLEEDIYSNLRIAFIYTKRNNIGKAYSYLEKAQSIDPSDYRARMFIGAIQLNNGQCESAIRSFRVASYTKRDSSALHVNLAASHWALGHTDKVVKELKKALTINPMDENALIFYSDVMFQLKQSNKSILPLEHFLKLEPNSKLVLERLARSYYFSGKIQKAKYVLEQQLNISDGHQIYNNLGLVFWQLGNRHVAIKCFSEAIHKAGADKRHSSIPVLNLASFLNDTKQYKESANLLSKYLNSGIDNVNDRILAKIAIQYFVSLESLEETERTATELNRFLSRAFKDIDSRILLLSCKVYFDAVVIKDKQEFNRSTDLLIELLANKSYEISEEPKRFAYNNIVFNYLYYDQIIDAQKYIGKIVRYTNLEPYCTATIGLFNIKKGNIETGIRLYDKSISLAIGRDFKDRIRQRMNLEIGKYLLQTGKANEASRYLIKASKETNGYKYAATEAHELLQRLESP